MDKSLDLLFGVLALQADLLTNDQFAEACSAWVTRRNMALADLLVERGWLTSGDKTDVQRLLERKLQKHGGNVQAGLAEAASPAVQHSLAGVADADLQASLRSLAGVPGTRHASDPTNVPTQTDGQGSTAVYEPEKRQQHTLTRLHAKGGVGQVWLAHDDNLGREVALKELQPERAGNPAVVARFLEEARITAQLQHPGVIPVYELSAGSPTQTPFYTMKFIRGRTLADACHQYERRRAAGEASPLEFRGLLGAFVTVCQAVAYAHSRNVIHRDLKTANVALGDFGEVLVLDFGLSKVVEEGNDARGQVEEPSSLLPVELPQVDSRDQTLQGQVLGTPSYMPPEQAEGRLDQIDQRSDIYSLGAILYEILTGAPPFLGPDSLETLKQVVHDPPVPPRQRVPSVPAALEAICLKALSKKPVERYASAADLAAEVQRFLADEPVHAFPEPWTTKARRWVSRHRTLVATAAAALVVAAVGLAIGAGLLAAAGERERVAHLDAEQKAQDARDAGVEAEKQRDEANRTAYAAGMGLAQRAWDEANVVRARQLLTEVPKLAAGKDLRGFEWHYLFRLCHSEDLSLEGHSAPVRSVAFSPDGQRLASGSQDQTVKIWETATSKVLFTLKGHTDVVTSVVFSPDGERLASGSYDKTVKIWETTTGHELFSLPNHSAWVTSVTFSPDSRRLASGSRDGTVRVWETATGKELSCFKGHSDWVMSVAFSPDGERLASGGYDMTVRIHEPATGKELLSVKGHSDSITSVAFSPNGQRLASCSFDRTVKVWEIVTGREVLSLKGHSAAVWSVAFSPDGERLASGGHDKTVKVWATATGRELFSLKAHSAPVWSVAFSPEGTRLASGGMDGTVKVSAAVPGKEVFSLRGHSEEVYCLAFSPDGQRLASGSHDKTVKVWETVTGNELLSLTGHSRTVTSVAFSSDGQRLVSGSADQTAKVWEAATGKELLTFKGHSAEVTSVAFSPDGQRLASGSKDRVVKVWKAKTGEELFTLQGHSGEVNSVAFSPDGRQVASGSQDRTVRVWEVSTGKELFSLQGHSAGVATVAYSPDGRRLASGSQDQTTKIWEAATGKELFTLNVHSGDVNSVAFSPDGQRLALGSADQTVKIWDAATAKELFTLKGHAELVASVAFSPDGRRLASGSWDRTIDLWETMSVPPEIQQWRSAKELVDNLFGQLHLRADVLERLSTARGMSASLRRSALAIARTHPGNAFALDQLAWDVVKLPGGGMAGYCQALRYTEEACRLDASNGNYLNTLGVANYRVGNYQKALETLVRSDKINAVENRTSQPADLAFLAMTEHRLGHAQEAQVYLERLWKLIKDPEWVQNGEARGFLREAEALLARPQGPRSK